MNNIIISMVIAVVLSMVSSIGFHEPMSFFNDVVLYFVILIYATVCKEE